MFSVFMFCAVSLTFYLIIFHIYSYSFKTLRFVCSNNLEIWLSKTFCTICILYVFIVADKIHTVLLTIIFNDVTFNSKEFSLITGELMEVI